MQFLFQVSILFIGKYISVHYSKYLFIIFFLTFQIRSYAETELCNAINRNDFIAATKLVVIDQVDINEKGYLGLAPLHYAAQHGNIDIIRLLIDEGALLDIKDSVGQRPIFYAITNNQLEAAKVLLNRNLIYGARQAYINAQDDEGKTAAHWACLFKNFKALRFLKEQGACLEIPDDTGYIVENVYDQIEAEYESSLLTDKDTKAPIREPKVSFAETIQIVLSNGLPISAKSIKKAVRLLEE